MVALTFSAFFSGSETALISVNRFRLEVWDRRGIKRARQAFEFLEEPEHFLTTTLVGNNIAIVAASSLMAVSLAPYINGFIITLVSSAFLLIFGEILPKSIARERATGFTLHATYYLRIFYVIFFPLIWSVMKLSQIILRILGFEIESVKSFFTREDLAMLVREGEQAGLVDQEERGLISRFVLRGNQKVREVMIPRTEMVVVKKNEPIRDVSSIFQKTGYSRLPVTGKTIDEILGMITVKDILLEKPERIKQVMRDVLFIPESANMASLLREMQEKNTGLAIVVDEYGGTAGLVTLEDIVEEFFGDIQDEYDDESSHYRKIGPRQIDVSARIQIEELNERFGLNLPEGEYQTLGGLLLDQLGHIPKRGERLEMTDCTLVILSAFRKKVSWVRIIK